MQTHLKHLAMTWTPFRAVYRIDSTTRCEEIARFGRVTCWIEWFGTREYRWHFPPMPDALAGVVIDDATCPLSTSGPGCLYLATPTSEVCR